MRRRPLLVVTAVVALGVGCTSGAGSSAPTTTEGVTTTTETPTIVVTQPPPTTTTVALPPVTPVTWRGCGDGFDCATVAVPVSYQDPTGATLDLALIKNPADHPEDRIGTLVLNPGGPGASGVRRVARGFQVSDEVADRFDIVGFDPRGIGESTPISCGSTVAAFRATDLAPDTPGESVALSAAAKAVADECAQTEGERLGHLGTREVVHDLEVIRRALGEEQLSFVGLSYGTLIGQLWAEWYPESVRAIVLDGVVDPAGGAATSGEQAEGVDASVAAMDTACAAAPACPVTDAGGMLAAYDELSRRLETGEVRSDDVGPTQLVYAAFDATYDADRWPILWDALAHGLDGDLRGIAELADAYERLVPYTPFALISCLDGPHAVGFEAWEETAAASGRASPRFGAVLANELLPCAFWPQGTYEPAPVEAPGTPPILVIGSTGDAATPYEAAVNVASRLDSGVLLTVEIDGHVALGDSDCATLLTTRYLVDLTAPDPGTRC